MQIVLLILLCYFLYRFITGFVLPVATTAHRIKKEFGRMNGQQTAYQQAFETRRQQEQATNAASDTSSNTGTHQRTTSGKMGAKEDYIDFEEVPVSQR
jgi:hypothetical protein